MKVSLVSSTEAWEAGGMAGSGGQNVTGGVLGCRFPAVTAGEEGLHCDT